MFPVNMTVPEKHKKLVDELLLLATDLRWSWSHYCDTLWKHIDLELWQNTRNPQALIQNLSFRRLDQLSIDTRFTRLLDEALFARENYLQRDCWADNFFDDTSRACIAYFSMEFGLGNALPLYAGGLGILAGDHLKAASDLGVPLVGIGLLYDQGYFRQMIDAEGWQQEIYCFNDSRNLPLQAVLDEEGCWLTISLQFPGRVVRLQVWRAKVGRVNLYLLDSNDPLNHPLDQGITGPLYGGSQELRLTQEIVLGIGGWRLIEALNLPISVCHLNEGHAAFAALERAKSYMRKHRTDFWQALCATRAGNIFTTHTPVSSAFDTFPLELLRHYGRDYADSLGISDHELLSLGHKPKDSESSAFNMAYLAANTCARINGVSKLHGEVSRSIFQMLYPRWPIKDVPVGHITNGVHVPTWDSASSDKVWTEACGKSRWLGEIEPLHDAIMQLTDEEIWRFRCEEREDLVHYARRRAVRQSIQGSLDLGPHADMEKLLDPKALTLGFARRFTQYKRPDLLLYDQARLSKILQNADYPVQLIVSGKAHPKDNWGKTCIQSWINFFKQANIRTRAVFIEDYDMALALELVQGVDVWINTPERPWEACGTSGMKVLVNGGLNLSALDGWWAEAYQPEIGWAIDQGHDGAGHDKNIADAKRIYDLLEYEIIPSFYSRDSQDIPRDWIKRIRLSMATLAPHFSGNRMVREYTSMHYKPAINDFNKRSELNALIAKDILHWQRRLHEGWSSIHWGNLRVYQHEKMSRFEVQVFLSKIALEDIVVELYSDHDAIEPASAARHMQLSTQNADPTNCYTFSLSLPTVAAAGHYTPRIIPSHPYAKIPQELPLISWWQGEHEIIKGAKSGFWEAV